MTNGCVLDNISTDILRGETWQGGDGTSVREDTVRG